MNAQTPETGSGQIRREVFEVAQTAADFEERLTAVRARINAAAARAGRSGDHVRLLPVSKTVEQERLRNAFAAGITHMAENKVQEAQRKCQEMADLDLTWAIIGHLQTNKAKDVAQFATEFQALDSLKLAEALDRRLQALGRGLDVYVQVNTSRETNKSGVDPANVREFVTALPQFTALQVRGFMTMAPFSADSARVRACFAELRTIRDHALDYAPGTMLPTELSMGMSGDFELAIEEGSTVVRVGQAIFGSRG